MAHASRPGGLTALAVVNFVLFGLTFFAVIGGLLMLSANPDQLDHDAYAQTRLRLMQDNAAKVHVLLLVNGVVGVLLLISGLGYLRLKKVMGRWVGTLAGVLGIAAFGFELSFMPLGLESLANVIYPLLSVVLINTTFRHDLVG